MEIPSELITFLRSTKRIAVLTGAGVSKESGLRTFRDAMDGLWAQYRPEDLATPEAFERNPELVWEFYAARRLKTGEVQTQCRDILPWRKWNSASPHFTLITQNVDGLHLLAGSKSVDELHGNIMRVKCSRSCGVVTEWDEDPGQSTNLSHLRGEAPPGRGLVRGNAAEVTNSAIAMQAARTCRVFFSIGTSGLVQPAASLPMLAKQNGAVIVEDQYRRNTADAVSGLFLF